MKEKLRLAQSYHKQLISVNRKLRYDLVAQVKNNCDIGKSFISLSNQKQKLVDECMYLKKCLSTTNKYSRIGNFSGHQKPHNKKNILKEKTVRVLNDMAAITGPDGRDPLNTVDWFSNR